MARPTRKTSPGRLALLGKRAGLRSRCGRVDMRVMYYTYVLISKKDKKLYIGYTDDLRKRFKEHLEGKVNSTKSRRPFELVYYEACTNKNKSIKREKYFKTGFGRKFLKNRL